MTDSPNSNGSPQAGSNAADDLNRVREILFGAEQRRTNEQIQELRNEYDQRLKALQVDTRRELDELRKELQDHTENLRAGKVDREDLAEMFGGIVSRLGAASSKLAGG